MGSTRHLDRVVHGLCRGRVHIGSHVVLGVCRRWFSLPCLSLDAIAGTASVAGVPTWVFNGVELDEGLLAFPLHAFCLGRDGTGRNQTPVSQ